MQITAVIRLLKQTYKRWSDHQAPRLGASVAFYTLLSFAPLLLLLTALLALVFHHQEAQNRLIDEARQIIGQRGAEAVKSLLETAQKPSSGLFASVVAFVTLLFGASGVFTELRDALNIIWDAHPQNESGWRGLVKQRLFSFGMVLSLGFLLLVSLVISTVLAFIGKSFGELVPMPPAILETANFVVSFAVIAVLFALMFKFVPAFHIPWRDVWVGAIGTALLFTGGKLVLGLYLGKASVGSAYGAAGSLVAVIVWVYYSAQIFFFGAEFTRVYADRHVNAASRNGAQQGVEGEGAESLPLIRAENATALPLAKELETDTAQMRKRLVKATILDDEERSHGKSGPSVWVAAVIGFVIGRASAKKKSTHQTR